MLRAFCRTVLAALVLVPATGLAGCSSEVGPSDEGGESALAVEPGPKDSSGSATEVWKVTHAWTDKLPGSTKTYEDDFVEWVAGLRRTKATRYGETLEITTPVAAGYSRTMGAPTLECADTALFLRVAYSSLNHLPFYVKSGDVYAGHFGFVHKDGTPHAAGANYRTSFKDFEGQWTDGQAWPSDKTLRAKHVAGYASGDDTFVEVTPGVTGGDGAWFDEFFLNKRVGYFLLTLVDMFGSTNLAQEGNLFHIKPEATRPGDALLHRHGKYAPIGHTLFVYQVRHPTTERAEIEVVSGSMPARQASWEPHYQSRNYFLSNEAGGDEVKTECRPDYSLDWNDQTRCTKEIGTIDKPASGTCAAPYEKHPWDDTKCIHYAVVPPEKTNLDTLGGGIRRFRTPVLSGGHWNNIVPQSATSVYIPDTDTAAIGARPKQFEQILSLGTPEQRKAAALANIASDRDYIRTAPSTCSKRTSREDAFQELYNAYSDLGEYDHAKIDKENRTLEDYVFAELDYDSSKTCCWNSTKREHFDTIMAWAQDVMAKAATNGTCIAPPVFDATGTGDGYEGVRTFAKAKNLPFPAAWTEDEPCKAKAVAQDTVTPRAKDADFCAANPPAAPVPPPAGSP
jgi:hypothetical protein